MRIILKVNPHAASIMTVLHVLGTLGIIFGSIGMAGGCMAEKFEMHNIATDIFIGGFVIALAGVLCIT